MYASMTHRATRALLRYSGRLSRTGTWPVRYGAAIGFLCLLAALLVRLTFRPLPAAALLATACAILLGSILFALLHRRRHLTASPRIRAAMWRYLRRPATSAETERWRMLADPVRSCALARGFSAADQRRLRSALIEAGAWEAVERAMWTHRGRHAAEAADALAWLDPDRAVAPLRRLVRGDRPHLDFIAASALSDIDRPEAYESLLDLLQHGDLPRCRIARLLDTARYRERLPHLESRSTTASPPARFWIRYLIDRQRHPETENLFLLSGIPALTSDTAILTARGFLEAAVDGTQRLLRMLVVVAGWLLFVYWWSIVLQGVRLSELVVLSSWFTAMLGVIALVAVLWIGHNLRLARRGSRGSSTRYIAPSFPTDTFGRQIRMDSGAAGAARVIVDVRDGAKLYAIPERGVPAEASS